MAESVMCASAGPCIMPVAGAGVDAAAHAVLTCVQTAVRLRTQFTSVRMLLMLET
jgi:hypothetical protein